MKPPKSIQIGACRYAVVLDPALTNTDKTGTFEGGSQKILVEPTQPPDNTRDTVLHEVLHGIIYHSGCQAFTRWTKEQEEAVVCSLTPLLLDTLQRNPRLVEYLAER